MHACVRSCACVRIVCFVAVLGDCCGKIRQKGKSKNGPLAEIIYKNIYKMKTGQEDYKIEKQERTQESGIETQP